MLTTSSHSADPVLWLIRTLAHLALVLALVEAAEDDLRRDVRPRAHDRLRVGVGRRVLRDRHWASAYETKHKVRE